MDAPEPTLVFIGDEENEFYDNWHYQAVVEVTRQRATAPSDMITMAVYTPDEHFWWACRRDACEIAGFPWATLVAFTSALVALEEGLDTVVVGNEKSANEGNGVFIETAEGKVEVNHQFDKSFAFESRLHSYLRQYVWDELHYFSGLQDLTELQIAARFVEHPEYLPVFFSCNEPDGDFNSEWCGRCAKCSFVFLLLAAYLPVPAFVPSPLPYNLFETPAAFPTFASLTGYRRPKPMDCVGTADEACMAVALAHARAVAAGGDLPLYFKTHADTALQRGLEALALTTLSPPSPNLFPTWFADPCNPKHKKKTSI
eukprot:Sspe_Gene.75144::Locus_46956_Transcript_1_1_Confidence_1.000_Length_1672::g.75144::m.75144